MPRSVIVFIFKSQASCVEQEDIPLPICVNSRIVFKKHSARVTFIHITRDKNIMTSKLTGFRPYSETSIKNVELQMKPVLQGLDTCTI